MAATPTRTEPASDRHDAFIAHRRTDKDVAREIKYLLDLRAHENRDALRARAKPALRVFFDEESIVAGTRAEQLLSHAARAERLVLICSSAGFEGKDSFLSCELLAFLTDVRVPTPEQLSEVVVDDDALERARARRDRVILVDLRSELRWTRGALSGEPVGLPPIATTGCLRPILDAGEPTRIAPDPGGERKSVAAAVAIAILASVLGVEPGTIASRAIDEARRRARTALTVAAVLAVVTIGAVLGGAAAYAQYSEANRQRELAETSAAEASAREISALADSARRMADVPAQQGEALLAALSASLRWPEDRDRRPLAETLSAVVASARRSLPIRSGHDDELDARSPIEAVRFDPEGAWIVSLGASGRICFHTLAGTLLSCSEPFEAGVALDVSNDGAHLCATWARADGTGLARVWDADPELTNTPLVQLDHPARFSACRFSRDGQRVLLPSYDGTVTVLPLDGASYELRTERDAPCARYGCLANAEQPDDPSEPCPLSDAVLDEAHSRVLAASWDGRIRVWNVAGGPELASWVHGDGNCRVTSLDTSPDGSLLVSAGHDGLGQVWSLRDGGRGAALRGHRTTIDHVELTSVDRILTTSWDQTAIVWRRDGTEWTIEEHLEGHSFFVFDGAFDATGREIITASSDGVRLWNDRRGNSFWYVPETRSPALVVGAVDPTASALLVGGSAQVLRASPGELVTLAISIVDPTAAAVSPTGAYLVVAGADGALARFDVLDPATAPTRWTLPNAAAGVAVSRDGTWIAAIDDAGDVYRVNARDATPSLLGHHRAGLRGVAVGDDGRWIATYFGDHRNPRTADAAERGAVFWDGAEGARWDVPGPTDRVFDVEPVAGAPEHAFLASDAVYAVDLSSREVARLDTGHANAVVAIDYDRTTGELAIGPCDGVLRTTRASVDGLLTSGVVFHAPTHSDCVDVVATATDGTVLSSSARSERYVRNGGLMLTGLLTGARAVAVGADAFYVVSEDGIRGYDRTGTRLHSEACACVRAMREATYPEFADLCPDLGAE